VAPESIVKSPPFTHLLPVIVVALVIVALPMVFENSAAKTD